MNVRTPPLNAGLQECITLAQTSAPRLMEALVDKAMTVIAEKSVNSTQMHERNMLDEAVMAMELQRSSWGAKFGQLLSEGMLAQMQPTAATPSPEIAKKPAAFNMDDLQLMDDSLVQTRIQSARMQQNTLLVCERELAELDSLVSAVLGLRSVMPEKNPFRPQVYVDAIGTLLEKSQAKEEQRALWSAQLGAALGAELKQVYTDLTKVLLAQGVQAASYRVVQMVVGGGYVAGGGGGSGGGGQMVGTQAAGAPGGVPGGVSGYEPGRTTGMPAYVLAPVAHGQGMQAVAADAHLAVQELRQMLDTHAPGGVVPARVPAPQAAPVAGMSEDEEMARLMRDIEEANALMQQLQQQPVAPAYPSKPAVPEQAQEDNSMPAQIKRMLEAHLKEQGHLIQSVRDWIIALQVPLERLVQRDVAVLREPKHVARLLIEEVAHRSKAFSSELAPGYEEFFKPVRQCGQTLLKLERVGSQHFAHSMQELERLWQRTQDRMEAEKAQAQLLAQQSQERKQLAERITFELLRRDDAAAAPIFIKQFFTHAWATVLAKARLHPDQPQDAQRYWDVVGDMLWSANVQETSQSKKRLIRTVPVVLATLREGMKSIQFDTERGEQFLGELIKLHEAALNIKTETPRMKSAASAQASLSSQRAALDTSIQAQLQPAQSELPKAAQASAPLPLIAPRKKPEPILRPEPMLQHELEEVDSLLPDDDLLVEAPSEISALASMNSLLNEPPAQPTASTVMPLTPGLPQQGQWVQLQQSGQWVRTQLTWLNPQNTLFMFTSSNGATHTMTRRALDTALAQGKLRLDT
jgi:hypothetical protein